MNKQRRVLGLAELTTIDPKTDLGAGAKTDSAPKPFNKAAAVRDVEAVSNYLSDRPALDEAASELTTALAELEEDPTVLDALRHRQLVEVGLPLVSDAACPLCDAAWEDAATLREHLNAKLARSEAAARLQQRIQAASGKVTAQLRSLRGLIQTAQPHAVTMGQASLQTALIDWSNDIAAFESKLARVYQGSWTGSLLRRGSVHAPEPAEVQRSVQGRGRADGAGDRQADCGGRPGPADQRGHTGQLGQRLAA